MKLNAFAGAALFVAAIFVGQSAHGAVRVWGNTSTDYNTGTNWGGTAPGAGDIGQFTAAESTQPNLSASLSNAGIWFMGTGSSGYDLTSTGGAALTLTGYSTSGSSGTSNSTAAAIRNEINSGTNTIDAALVLAPASGTTSYFVESGAGTLVVNGGISGSGISLSLRGGAGVIQLNGNNSFSGGASIDTAGETLVIGNDSALGSGTFTNSATSTIQAGGGGRTLANNVVLAGNTTLSGSNPFTFNGTFTSSGSSSRTLTVSNSGGAIFGGTVNLEESGAPAGRVFAINGTSAVNINGVVQDGSAQPAILKYTGSSTLTLNNTNTYSGGTQETIAGSTIVAFHDHALGTGNVSLTTASVTLTLQGGTLNDYIANNAILSFVTGDTVNLNFNGTDTIGGLVIDGVAQAPGLYNNDTTTQLIGTGNLLVVPEPATLAMLLLGGGLLASIQRIRSKRS